MTFFACPKCSQAYRKQYSARQISAAETAFAIPPTNQCAQCKAITTSMALCLACGLEKNQCQQCRKEMHGVDDGLLAQVAELRDRFAQGAHKHEHDFKAAIDPFRQELEAFLARMKEIEAQYVSGFELPGADTSALVDKFGSDQREARKQFLQFDQYDQARRQLEERMTVDKSLFAGLVEYYFEQVRLRRELCHCVERASSSPGDFTSTQPPDLVSTPLSDYALFLLTDAERAQMAEARQRSHDFGRQLYERMLNQRPS